MGVALGGFGGCGLLTVCVLVCVFVGCEFGLVLAFWGWLFYCDLGVSFAVSSGLLVGSFRLVDCCCVT